MHGMKWENSVFCQSDFSWHTLSLQTESTGCCDYD